MKSNKVAIMFVFLLMLVLVCGISGCLPPNPQECYDSDGGINYEMVGTAKDGMSSSIDYCINDIELMENYCSYGKITGTIYSCPAGCVDGACVSKYQECYDSDGGIDYYTQGTTSGRMGGYEEVCHPEEACPTGVMLFSDKCGSDGELTEYYCENNIIYNTKYFCDSGICEYGACLKEGATCENEGYTCSYGCSESQEEVSSSSYSCPVNEICCKEQESGIVELILTVGETEMVSIGGIDHTIELFDIYSGLEAYIIVDGEAKNIVEDSAYTFSNMQVYVEDITFYSWAGGQDQSSVQLRLEGTTSTPIVPSVPNAVCGETITASTTLTSDLTNCPGKGLIIAASNIVLDCAGHSITGSNINISMGIDMNTYGYITNIIIRNCIVNNFYYGLFMGNSYQNQIISSTFSGQDYGAYLTGSYNNVFTNSIFSGNTKGIFVSGGSGNKGCGNTGIISQPGENSISNTSC